MIIFDLYVDKEMAAAANSLVTAPLETICAKFNALSKLTEKHGATYRLGFGAKASKVTVYAENVKDLDSFEAELNALDGVEKVSFVPPLPKVKKPRKPF